MERVLHWEGCFNARDLGGLPTRDGGHTRRGALVRSDQLSSLTANGWSALHQYGIRTVIDLRDDESRASDIWPRPSDLMTLHIPLEDRADTVFWERWGAASGLYATPLYYRAFLDQFPRRCVAVVRAIACAGPGGVVVHCRVGRDRTGLIALLLLALVGVGTAEVAADYELSATYLPALFAARGEPDEGPSVEAILRREGTTAREAIEQTLDGLDVERYLRTHGLLEAEMNAIRARLLGVATSV
jgi:protein-tyrosine phosphatase